MNRVKIITDSTADLTQELLDKLEIEVLPLYVLVNGTSYLDGIEMTTDELYRQIEESKTLPKTSAPSTGDFYEIFSKWVQAGYDVLYRSFFQTSYVFCQTGSRSLTKDRWVLDSPNLSTGIGLLVLEAVKWPIGMGQRKFIRKYWNWFPRQELALPLTL